MEVQRLTATEKAPLASGLLQINEQPVGIYICHAGAKNLLQYIDGVNLVGDYFGDAATLLGILLGQCKECIRLNEQEPAT